MNGESRSLRLGEVAELGAGSFIGMIASNFSYLVPIGNTVRARIAFGSMIAVGLGALGGWLISKGRRNLGAGFAGGAVGMGFAGLLSILIGPSAVLDMAAPKSFSESPASGLSGLIRDGRRRMLRRAA